ncbi:MAG: 8-oxo-dGTP diphosphatase MutT [Candidatus Eisenbacteria bacterium]|nr:8-oxo-dGTP diphosphatase MutT [Candidatus Eisenbacteria bacterium]
MEVAAGVIRQGEYVLIARRLAEAHLGGFWEFPGGTREDGESLEECLVREIKEELDLTVRVGRLALTVRQEYPDRSLDLHFYLCTPVAGTPAAIGCAEFRWVTLRELSDFEFPPADLPLIEQLQAAPGN